MSLLPQSGQTMEDRNNATKEHYETEAKCVFCAGTLYLILSPYTLKVSPYFLKIWYICNNHHSCMISWYFHAALN